LVLRQRVSTAGTGCGSAWADDGAATPGTGSLVATGLQINTCYRWRVTATDTAGNSSTVTSGALRLGTTTLATQIEGGSIFSSEPLQVHTSEATIARVEYRLDNAIVSVASQAPYSAAVDTTQFADGQHTLTATVVHADNSMVSTPPATIQVANGLGPSMRLDADLAAGSLSLDDWVLDGLFAYEAPQALPSRYASSGPSAADDIPSLRYLQHWGQLQPATQAAVESFLDGPIGEFYALPTSGSVGPAEADFTGCTSIYGSLFNRCTYTTEHFVISYIPVPASYPSQTLSRPDGAYMLVARGAAPWTDPSNGQKVPPVVHDSAAAAEAAYATYTSAHDDMGWTAPSGLINGGRITLQLDRGCVLMDGNADGETNVQILGAGTICIDPSKQNDAPHRLWQLDGTIPHEVFHTFQNAAVSWSDGLAGARAWYEATANWALHRYQFYNGITDPGEYTSVSVPSYYLTAAEDLSLANHDREYGEVPVTAYLEATQHGSVRATFDRLAQQGALNSSADSAIRSVLTLSGQSMATEWLDYAQQAYEMKVGAGDGGWQAEWSDRMSSQNDPAAGGRPDRQPGSPFQVPLAPGWSSNQETEVADLGMAYVDLEPASGIGAQGGLLKVKAEQLGTNLALRLVPYDMTPGAPPTVCSGAMTLSFVDGVAEATVPLTPFCRTATLVVVGADGASSVAWEAQWAPAAAADPFTRVVSPGWGDGPLGTWQTYDPSEADPTHVHPNDGRNFSVDGGSGMADQLAPYGALGDLTVGLDHALADPSVTPIDIVYTFTQSRAAVVPHPGYTFSFIDDVFAVGGGPNVFGNGGLGSAYVDLTNFGPGGALEIEAYDSRTSVYDEITVQRPFQQPVPGAPLKLRLRIDAYGTHAKLWAAADQEPAEWTSEVYDPQPVSQAWAPSWLILEPMQTDSSAPEPQSFRLDSVQVLSGWP
jgi:hypothetical protein